MSNEFIHYFERGDRSRAPLLTLHGTAGDEDDLVPLAMRIAPKRGIISPRGKVSEGGMNRFFERFSNGEFNEVDLRFRANELADFISAKHAEHGWKKAPIALGFSNGGNIAAAMLYLRPDVLSGAILCRSVIPFGNLAPPPLAGKPLLLISGDADPYLTPEKAVQMANVFKAAGASVQHHILPAGHNLSQGDVDLAHKWLKDQA